MCQDKTVFSKRISRIRSGLSNLLVDKIIFLDMKNIRYLTGFTGSDGALVVGPDQSVLLVDGRYTHQAKREASDTIIFEYRDKVDGIASVLQHGTVQTVGFELTVMHVQTYLKLKEKIKNLTLKPISDAIDAIRAIKDETEIACMRKAAEISFQAMNAVRQRIRPGVMEKDIALELDFKMRQYGAEQVAFPIIVASGSNASMPHAKPGLRKIKKGDAVIIDYGAVYQGYHSDETWTVFVDSADHRKKEVYTVVKEAFDRSRDAAKPGVPCKEIDQIARSFIEDSGFGKYFSHGTGHGVGLDVHEAPRISMQSEQVLQKDMIVTIEPGIYMPGNGAFVLRICF